MTKQQKAYLFALAAIFLWSTVATAFKIALRYVDFSQLLFYSTGVSLLVFISIAFAQGRLKSAFRVSGREWLKSARNGFLNPFLYYMILLKAYSVLPAQMAQPLNYLWPMMLVLLSVPMLGEKLKIQGVFSVIFGFSGVYVIATRGDILNFNIENPTGVLLAVGSSVIWALSWILNKKNKSDETAQLLRNFLFGFIYISLYSALNHNFILPSFNGLLAVTYIGFFEMGFTFFFWMRAMQLTTRSDSIGNLVFLSPFMALIFIYFILGENIYYTSIFGLVLIVVGIFVNRIKFKTRK